MLCSKCTSAVLEQDIYEHAGQTLCEDCYIDAVSAPKTCDPWAVYVATRTKSKGDTLPADLQRILDVITASGPISLEQICSQLALDEREFRARFSTLRHMELAQVCKVEGQVLYIPFQKTNGS
ncbi:hypothetical protein SAMN02745220_00773 [Desulfopila aestuarii DSM 18488]|uniref:Uncharacterized protein n=1 Tax=Desulfopila aestuarii DSM 18488 TaxID=1121416 RepID=A0A1M7XZL4_9BACT|nr:hypothetical protein SAMN02745220_00773 [Desulfopila aestuarii DSM 18488]